MIKGEREERQAKKRKDAEINREMPVPFFFDLVLVSFSFSLLSLTHATAPSPIHTILAATPSRPTSLTEPVSRPGAAPRWPRRARSSSVPLWRHCRTSLRQRAWRRRGRGLRHSCPSPRPWAEASGAAMASRLQVETTRRRRKILLRHQRRPRQRLKSSRSVPTSSTGALLRGPPRTL